MPFGVGFNPRVNVNNHPQKPILLFTNFVLFQHQAGEITAGTGQIIYPQMG